MGNRGVIHKAGSFWIWLPKLRPKPHWNWNGMQILANVGHSRMNLPFGDSLYHPFVVIWELVYAWVYHSTQIGIFFSSWNPFSTWGSRTCWDHFLIELWWSAKLSGLTTREYMALYPPKNTLFISCLPHPIQYLWSDNLGKPQANLTGRPPMMVARGIIRRMANLSRLWTIYQVFRWINPQCSTSVCNDCWLMRCFLKWKTPKPPNQPFSYWKSLKTDMFGSFRGSHFKKPWWVSIAN